ncbi:hypothetical protein JCGZ_15416 [Jatropha curcas]|uniref:Uncharacterized protein n=1 Tax=Jatropha curcas TaxID=180498 RepID=A0A067K5K9_JATCU|nr:hypothetical protein JCGZ_15416 [Jatropha curcas]
MASGSTGLFAVQKNRLFEPQNLIWAYEYRIYPGGPKSDTSTEAQWIPRYLAHHHHTLSSLEDPYFWRRYLNDRALADELEIGRLRRHQSRQATAVSHLQMEVDRLWTRLEVEGIPLDFSEAEEDDDDGSLSDDAPPPPPSSVRQAAAGPSRR